MKKLKKGEYNILIKIRKNGTTTKFSTGIVPDKEMPVPYYIGVLEMAKTMAIDSLRDKEKDFLHGKNKRKKT